MTDYEVIGPEQCQNRVGLTYQDLIESWANWLVCDSPDLHNNSQIVFLRGIDFPESVDRLGYSGRPVMMVGTRSLNISSDQYLFLPLINTLVNELDDHAATEQDRRFIAWRDTILGDYPPMKSQIKIDGQPLSTGVESEQNLQRFLAWSRDFMLRVPDVPYGRSLKDYLDIPITVTGNVPAVACGFWVLIKFNALGPHTITFHASGIMETFGQYITAGVYTVNISSPKSYSAPPLGSKSSLDSSVKQKLLSILQKRIKENAVTDEETKTLEPCINAMGS